MILLINPFDKIPGEQFRDQRYSFLYRKLYEKGHVRWLSSNFHHWTRKRRDIRSVPHEHRDNIDLLPTLPYSGTTSIRRFASHLLLAPVTLARLIRLRERPSLVICVGPIEQELAVVLWCRVNRIPVIVDVLDLWPDLYVNALSSRLRWLGRVLLSPLRAASVFVYRYADKVTAVSEAYAQWAARRGRRAYNRSFSYYYLGCSRSVPFSPRLEDGAIGKIRCLFAGQFGLTYDIELLIEVAAECRRTGRPYEFVFCGDGAKRPLIETAAKQWSNIELHGWLSPEELSNVAMGCQVGLCAYRADATQSVPTKLFDYLAMGLAIASSLKGECAHLIHVHDVGLTYEPNLPSDLVRVLDRLARERRLDAADRMKIRRIFEQNFASEEIYDRMIEDLILPIATSAES